ncbi:hypothetical protein E3N88_31406 [Mikania micrantha]|uniref:Dehydrogenase E1 component domain-containing protein n=1 Tax=Mikania micrantha TaxID=192012 RepID=A0A5N6MRM6_9ASTR|nr:hypothetical protein E3N88_31401 [Mikania micrantha]KAD3642182.1 hypothetical protein E3N88_31406 [Mikania micrantha]
MVLARRSSGLLKPLTTASSAPLLHRRPFSTDDTTTITVETSVPFTGHKCDPPSRSVDTTPKELMNFFTDMALMRRMEIAADSLYKSKLIRGFCHLYDGQEAVSIGMEAAITKRDCIITAYRDHGIFLGRGGTLLESFAELMGRQAGCSRGKGGSMHFYKKDACFFGGHGIVGAQVDGMDALAVKQACKFAKEHALKNGPIILEMDTYRYHGHSMSDPGSTYRTRDEISGVRQERDPIERVRKLILAHDLATEKELKDIEKQARKEVDEAIAQAKESPMPDESELFTNVYRKGLGVESFGTDRKELRATLP